MSIEPSPELSAHAERLSRLLETYTERVRALSRRRSRRTLFVYGIVLTGLLIISILASGVVYFEINTWEVAVELIQGSELIAVLAGALSGGLLGAYLAFGLSRKVLRRMYFREQEDELILASGRLLASIRIGSQFLDHADLHVIDQMTLGLLLNDAREAYLESLDYVSEEKVKKEARLARPKNWDAREEAWDPTEEAQNPTGETPKEAPVGQ